MHSVLVTLFTLAACGGGRETSAGSEPPPRSAHPAPGAAIERCIATLEDLPAMDPAVKVNRLLEGCSQIFAESGCRAAWNAAATAPPSKKQEVMIAGCRAAYCRVLEPPKPALCTIEGSLDWSSPVDRARYVAGWHELMERALQRDLGAERSEKLAAAFAELGRADERPLPRLSHPGPAPAQPETVAIDVTVSGSTVHIVFWFGDTEHGTWDLATPLTESALAGLSAEARRHTASGTAILRAQPEITYADLVAVMGVLHDAGFQNLSLQGQP